jgi:hypothetical protein
MAGRSKNPKPERCVEVQVVDERREAYDTIIHEVSLAVVSPCKSFLMHVMWRDDKFSAQVRELYV